MQKHESDLGGLYQELGKRFEALSELFGKLSSPSAAKELLDSLTLADAAKPFPKIVDIKIPMLGKCFWIREIIEHVVSTPAGFVEECRVRDNLTPSEADGYFSIAWRYRMEGTLVAIVYGAAIPPGPFLDELKAKGLVTCENKMTDNTSVIGGFSPPSRVCI